MFKGSMTALVTPFQDGEVDYRAYEQLVERQIAAGTHALVPVGTTGESPTLSHEEHCLVVETCLKVAKGKVPVIAGTGSNSTKEAIAFTAHAKKAGADAALIVSPYYNKPTQEGLYTHFKAIHDAVSIPIILYNIPGRSVVDISVETMARLSQLPNIIGVKDATADLARVSLQRAACAKDFIQLSGEDATALGFNAQGGQGCISVTANVAPELCGAFQSHMLAGDYDKALVVQDQLMPLHDALFCESNPVPAKYALHKLGLCRQEVRLPLVPLTAAGREKIDSALAASGLV